MDRQRGLWLLGVRIRDRAVGFDHLVDDMRVAGLLVVTDIGQQEHRVTVRRAASSHVFDVGVVGALTAVGFLYAGRHADAVARDGLAGRGVDEEEPPGVAGVVVRPDLGVAVRRRGDARRLGNAWVLETADPVTGVVPARRGER